MVWFVYIAMSIAIGILVMMYDEISSGFYRRSDYIVTAVLLYGTGAILFYLAGLVPPSSGLLMPFVFVVKALLGFGVSIMVWGGTLSLGSLILSLFRTRQQT
jgi:hypothetical protein